MITETVKISFVRQTVPHIVNAVQGDSGRVVIFEPDDFVIPEGATATYYVEKTDGEAVYNTATIDGNKITVPFTAQALAASGDNNGQVRIELNGEYVTSFAFLLRVLPFYGIDAIESDTEINIFDKAVEEATEQIRDSAEEVAQEVIDSIPADYTALTTEVTDLKADLTVQTGQVEIVNGWNADKRYSVGTGATLDIAVMTSTDNYSCIAVPCSEGDVFIVTAKGASGSRPWAFLSSASGDRNIITRADAGDNNYYFESQRIVAPQGAQYLIVNAYVSGYSRKLIKGDYLNDGVESLASKTRDQLAQLEAFSGVRLVEWDQGNLNATYGSPNDSAVAIRTGFIPVVDNQTIVFNNPNGKTWKVYPYDADKAFMLDKVKAATNETTGTFEIDSTIKYIRVQMSDSNGITPDEADGFVITSLDGYIFDYIDKKSGYNREISILFVGNSLTQDGIAYLPYFLKHYYPEISFKFYMWYNGGKTLGDQYNSYFLLDRACSIFSVAENEEAWTNYESSVKMSQICTDYKFDIVCMQEYFNYKDTYTVSDLSDWTNCRDYIQSHYTGGNGLEFISLFHAPLRSNADDVFTRTKAGNALILQNTITQDMIPNGIAVYRALSTALDDLGDRGHLSPDGTHTQEGLPCLLQTFVTACWLFDRLSINKSVYGSTMRMTTAIYDTLNIPGANLGTGVITGTDAENLLAQEVAIQAYKEGKQFVMQNIFTSS